MGNEHADDRSHTHRFRTSRDRLRRLRPDTAEPPLASSPAADAEGPPEPIASAGSPGGRSGEPPTASGILVIPQSVRGLSRPRLDRLNPEERTAYDAAFARVGLLLSSRGLPTVGLTRAVMKQAAGPDGVLKSDGELLAIAEAELALRAPVAAPDPIATPEPVLPPAAVRIENPTRSGDRTPEDAAAGLTFDDYLEVPVAAECEDEGLVDDLAGDDEGHDFDDQHLGGQDDGVREEVGFDDSDGAEEPAAPPPVVPAGTLAARSWSQTLQPRRVPLRVPVLFVWITPSPAQAVVLSWFAYWSGTQKDGWPLTKIYAEDHWWVSGLPGLIAADTGLTRSQVRHANNSLVERGLLVLRDRSDLEQPDHPRTRFPAPDEKCYRMAQVPVWEALKAAFDTRGRLEEFRRNAEAHIDAFGTRHSDEELGDRESWHRGPMRVVFAAMTTPPPQKKKARRTGAAPQDEPAPELPNLANFISVPRWALAATGNATDGLIVSRLWNLKATEKEITTTYTQLGRDVGFDGAGSASKRERDRSRQVRRTVERLVTDGWVTKRRIGRRTGTHLGLRLVAERVRRAEAEHGGSGGVTRGSEGGTGER